MRKISNTITIKNCYGPCILVLWMLWSASGLKLCLNAGISRIHNTYAIPCAIRICTRHTFLRVFQVVLPQDVRNRYVPEELVGLKNQDHIFCIQTHSPIQVKSRN